MPLPTNQLPQAFNFLFDKARFKVAEGGRGSGKCLGRGTKVVMRDGSMKAVEDVQVGDQLLGIDGTARNVLSVTSGVAPLYEVSQISGQPYITNGDHILCLEQGESQLAEGRHYFMQQSGGLISVADYLAQSEKFKTGFFGFKREAKFSRKTQPLAAYFVGAWLGDGHSHAPAVTTMDPEIVAYLKSFAAEHGVSVHVTQKPGNRASTYNLTTGNKVGQQRAGRNSIRNALVNLNLLDNKHIPDCYARGSTEQRLQLLAGIIDTDGYLDRNSYAIVMAREPLLRQIKWVADSLGFKTSFRYKVAKCQTNQHCDAWHLSIGGDIDKIPCLLPRKKITSMSKNKDWRRTRVNVRPLPPGEYFGFSLDGDHRFFLEDFTVTHNSSSYARALLSFAWHKNERILCGREIQDSIKDSVKALFDDLLQKFDPNEKHFKSTRDEIRGKQRNQSVILFTGLKANPEALKSKEGITKTWLEEANTTSERSWTVLEPTIRKEDSEIWLTYNRRFTTDHIDTIFHNKHGPPPNSIVRKIGYWDNPFFPQVLREQMAWTRKVDIERYKHVWLGMPLDTSDAQVFRNYISSRTLPLGKGTVLLGADWGFATDPIALVRLVLVEEERRIYVTSEAGKHQCEIEDTPDLFRKIPNATTHRWRADSARPELISYMKRQGFDVVPSKKGNGSVIEGYAFLQNYEIVIHPDCPNTQAEVQMARYKIDKITQKTLPELVDANNHYLDAMRYALEEHIRAARKSAPSIAQSTLVAGGQRH